MKRELGIARCGLACCLCSENTHCDGCHCDQCKDMQWCQNRQCSIDRGLDGCYQCDQPCRKGLLEKIKPYGFTLFIRKYGLDTHVDLLERNEANGVVYHRSGISGDYDDFDDADALLEFIKSGRK